MVALDYSGSTGILQNDLLVLNLGASTVSFPMYIPISSGVSSTDSSILGGPFSLPLCLSQYKEKQKSEINMSLGENSKPNENQGGGNTDKGSKGRMVFCLTGLKKGGLF